MMHSERPDAQSLAALRLFRGVSGKALEAMHAHIEYVPLKPHSTLRIREAYPERAIIVWSGEFLITLHGPNDDSIELLPLARGDTFGFAGAVNAAQFGPGVRLSTTSGGAILLMRYQHIAETAKQDPDFNANLMSELASLVVDYASRVFELGVLSVRERLELKLLRLAEHAKITEAGHAIENAPTHAALARAIGASREAVTRHLNDLADAGVVTIQRNRIVVRKLNALHTTARARNAQLVSPDRDGN